MMKEPAAFIADIMWHLTQQRRAGNMYALRIVHPD